MPAHSERFAGRKIAVTGAASGIGRAAALRMAQEGGLLYLLDRDRGALAEVAAEASNCGSAPAEADVIDVTDNDQAARAIERFQSRRGALDCLVHCVGVVGQSNARAHEADLETFRHVIDVNLIGAFIMCRAVLPGMLANRYGRILLISSMAGKDGNPRMAGYVASKAALIGLVKTMGKEYARDGVTVNALAPAVIATPMNRSTDPETVAALCEKIPMGRMGTTDEAASIISWICSDEASFNTGAVFDLSGGRATY